MLLKNVEINHFKSCAKQIVDEDWDALGRTPVVMM
jgi:hypothetical protein